MGSSTWCLSIVVPHQSECHRKLNLLAVALQPRLLLQASSLKWCAVAACPFESYLPHSTQRRICPCPSKDLLCPSEDLLCPSKDLPFPHRVMAF